MKMKSYIKIVATTFIMLAIFSFKPNEKNNHYNTKWVVQHSSSLCVEGKSNVNKFSCEITDYCKFDTISFFKSNHKKDDNYYIMNGCMKLDITSFNCHDILITRDFRKTLKSKENPMMTIHFEQIEKFEPSPNSQVVKGIIKIRLANVIKEYEIDYVVLHSPGNKIIHLIGNKKMNLSDFGLKPVSKMGGLIKVDDQLKVNFFLVLGST
jgi:hypothetical protein